MGLTTCYIVGFPLIQIIFFQGWPKCTVVIHLFCVLSPLRAFFKGCLGRYIFAYFSRVIRWSVHFWTEFPVWGKSTNKTTFTILYLISHKSNHLHFELIWSWCVGLDIKCRSVRVWMEVCSDMRWDHTSWETRSNMSSALQPDMKHNLTPVNAMIINCIAKKHTAPLSRLSSDFSSASQGGGGTHREHPPRPFKSQMTAASLSVQKREQITVTWQ